MMLLNRSSASAVASAKEGQTMRRRHCETIAHVRHLAAGTENTSLGGDDNDSITRTLHAMEDG